jgi:hypothetical protein
MGSDLGVVEKRRLRAVFWCVTPLIQLEAHLFTRSAIRFSDGLRKTMKI